MPYINVRILCLVSEELYMVLNRVLEKNQNLDVTCIRIADKTKILAEYEQNSAGLIIIENSGYKSDITSTLESIGTRERNLPVIIICEDKDESKTYKWVKAGAEDYIFKSELTGRTLERTLRYAWKRHHTHKKLSGKTEQFKLLFRESSDAVIIADGDYKIYKANPAFSEMFGVDEEEVRGINLQELFTHEEDYLKFRSALDSGVVIKLYDISFKKQNAESFQGILSAGKLSVSREIDQGFQITIHDLSTYIESQKQAKRAEMLQLSRRMARTIAHEIRNPLTNIELSVRQLYEAENLPEESNNYLAIIKRNSERIEDLVSQMIKSARPDVVIRSDLDLGKVIRKSIDYCRDRIKLNKLRFETEIEDRLMCSGDENYLRIAFVNLITNAVEATKNTKQPRLKIHAGSSNGNVFVIIEDNGKGMSEEEMKHLFDPFYSSKQKGMGLGMTLVENVILDHNGKISLKSIPEKGTKFTISIPSNGKSK